MTAEIQNKQEVLNQWAHLFSSKDPQTAGYLGMLMYKSDPHFCDAFIKFSEEEVLVGAESLVSDIDQLMATFREIAGMEKHGSSGLILPGS